MRGQIPEDIADERAQRYIEVMSGLAGRDILSRSRQFESVWGRYIVAYQLRSEGMVLMRIGKLLKKDHSTVFFGISQVANMLEMPKLYEKEYAIWKQFQKQIKDE